MKALHYILIFIVMSGWSGISIIGVDKADNFTISNYKTFDFFKIDASGDALSEHSKENLELIKTAITKELQAKGVTQSSTDPDLLVNIGVVVLEKVQTRETRVGEYPTYMGTRNYSWQRQDIEVGRYRDGTVTVHLVEPETKKMVWKGAAQGVLPNKQTGVPGMIDQGMKELFAKVKWL